MARSTTRKPSAASRRRPRLARSAPTPWIGRLADDPGAWVLAWAPTRARAQRMIEQDVGAVDPGSVMRLRGAGYFLFRSSPHPDPGVAPAAGEYLIFYDPVAEAWIAGADA